MAKSPAVLFYTADFLVGTAFMDDAEIGRYIKLLCIQHQRGRMSREQFFSIAKEDDTELFGKFEIDGDGRYYNLRMDLEVEKRAKYAESRSKNRKKTCKSYVSSYDEHMENENIHKVITGKIDKKKEEKARFVPPSKEAVDEYVLSIGCNGFDSDRFVDFYTSKGWMVGKTKMRDWRAAVRNWSRNNKEQQTGMSESLRARLDAIGGTDDTRST